MTLEQRCIAGVTLGHVTLEVGGVASLKGTVWVWTVEWLGVLVAQLVSPHCVVVTCLPPTQGTAVWALPGVLPGGGCLTN